MEFKTELELLLTIHRWVFEGGGEYLEPDIRTDISRLNLFFIHINSHFCPGFCYPQSPGDGELHYMFWSINTGHHHIYHRQGITISLASLVYFSLRGGQGQGLSMAAKYLTMTTSRTSHHGKVTL